MRVSLLTLLASIFICGGVVWGQQTYVPPPQTAFPPKWRNAVEKRPWTMPLYDGPIPNSTGAPDAESEGIAVRMAGGGEGVQAHHNGLSSRTGEVRGRQRHYVSGRWILGRVHHL